GAGRRRRILALRHARRRRLCARARGAGARASVDRRNARVLLQTGAALAAGGAMTEAELLERAKGLSHVLRSTPVVRLEQEQVELYAKLEMLNGIGSIKDRPACFALQRAVERGEIGPSTTVVESSSGNFALALAVFCRMLGLNFIPVIDPNISPVS